MDVLTTRELEPTELASHELDAVAGGLSFLATAVAVGGFIYMNLDKLADSYNGFMDGLSAGFNNTPSGSDVTATCTP